MKRCKSFILSGVLALLTTGTFILSSPTAHASSVVDTAETHITLPVFPLATQSHRDWFTLVLQPSGGWEAGSARFAVNASDKSVSQWYAVHMHAAGFNPQSSARMAASGLIVPGWYVSSRNPGVTVQIAYERAAQRPDLLWISYYVTEVPIGHKPASALVPPNSIRVMVRYNPASSHSVTQPIMRTITNTAWIRELINDINALPVDTRQNQSEDTGLFGGAMLYFYTSSGATKAVTVAYTRNQVQIGTTSLFDLRNTVWLLVSNDLHEAPYPAK